MILESLGGRTINEELAAIFEPRSIAVLWSSLTLGSLGIATLIAAVAVGVFSVILFSGLSYMSKHDLNRLFCYITVGIAALSAGTSLVCAISTNRAVSRRERP